MGIGNLRIRCGGGQGLGVGGNIGLDGPRAEVEVGSWA